MLLINSASYARPTIAASSVSLPAYQSSDTSLATVLTLYYRLSNDLVSGNAGAAAGRADSLATGLARIGSLQVPDGDNEKFTQTQKTAGSLAAELAGQRDIEKQRAVFSGLSQSLWQLARIRKPAGTGLYQLFCPMKKAYWLSPTAQVRNPYYGKQMLACGKVTDSIQ